MPDFFPESWVLQMSLVISRSKGDRVKLVDHTESVTSKTGAERGAQTAFAGRSGSNSGFTRVFSRPHALVSINIASHDKVSSLLPSHLEGHSLAGRGGAKEVCSGSGPETSESHHTQAVCAAGSEKHQGAVDRPPPPPWPTRV